jgi:two-component system sensor histidine kinase DesK
MTDPSPVAPGALSEDLAGASRMWGGRWGRFWFPGFWLVYLGAPISRVATREHGWREVAGFVIVAAFAACYLLALEFVFHQDRQVFQWLYATALALTVAESFFAQERALGFLVYVAVLTIATRSRYAGPMIVALVLTAALLPPAVRSWHSPVDWNTALTIALVSIAMVGFFKVIQSNIALAAARAEVARLAAENERSRIARDLHDLLGHSLTTITVKAGLARRLAEHGEADRAQTEITEVETLSRRTLADVRAAVAGHHDVTLTGELATAREVLRAAGIAAELPGSVDVVDPAASEVLGWALREGVTNVVRHSRAAHCVITLGPHWLEIVDDGHGGAGAPCGTGLTGLRERVAGYGGTVEAERTFRGWRLRVDVPAVPHAGAAAPDAVNAGEHAQA